MNDYIITVHVNAATPEQAEQARDEIVGSLQDADDSGLLAGIGWAAGEPEACGPYASLVEKAAQAHYVRLADGELLQVDSVRLGRVYLCLDDKMSSFSEADLAGATFYRLQEF